MIYKNAIKFEDKIYKQITKTKAREMFNEGKEIIVNPCKIIFPNHWHSHCYISKDMENMSGEWTFDQIVNNCEYYNCCYETGYYSHYFVEIE